MNKNGNSSAQLIRSSLYFAFVYFFLSIVFYFSNPFISRLIIPVLEYGIEAVSSDYVVTGSSIEKNPDKITFDILVKRKVRDPHSGGWHDSFSMKGSVKSEISVLHFLLVFSLISVWPDLGHKERLRLLACTLPLLLILTSIDAAFIVRGYIEAGYESVMSVRLGNDGSFAPETCFSDYVFLKGGRNIASLSVFFGCLYCLKRNKATFGEKVLVSRNSICPCGSGRKHKKCCMKNEAAKSPVS